VTIPTSTASRASRLPAATLALAAIGAASLAGRIVLEALRGSDECNTAFVRSIEWLIWIALLSSTLALVVGGVALATRSQPIALTVGGIGLVLVVGVLLFVPGFAFIVCGEAAA
jgi:hypothetical protein